jgi:hypothetical protein
MTPHMVRVYKWCPHPSCLTVSQGSCHNVPTTVERYIPTLNPEFLLFNSHSCTSLANFAVVRFLSSLSYTFTLVRLVAGFNLGVNAPRCINVYIYALFTCPTSLTVSFR